MADPNLHRPMALQETPVILPGHDFETVTETINATDLQDAESIVERLSDADN